MTSTSDAINSTCIPVKGTTFAEVENIVNLDSVELRSNGVPFTKRVIMYDTAIRIETTFEK
jgi:hypothetical protein